MDRNLNSSTSPIGTCTQTTPHHHSPKELQQLLIARNEAGRRGRQVFACPMIRASRRSFDDTYEVRSALPLSGEPRSEEEDVRLHASRVQEADVQVGNVLLGWHCDGWPVATPRTTGEADLDGDAPMPAPVPAPSGPTCGGYAHCTAAAQLEPTRAYDYEGYDRHRADRAAALQHSAEARSVASLAPNVRTGQRRDGRQVAFDARFVHFTAAQANPQQSNFNVGWYEKSLSPVRRQSSWEIEYAVMIYNGPTTTAYGSGRLG